MRYKKLSIISNVLFLIIISGLIVGCTYTIPFGSRGNSDDETPKTNYLEVINKHKTDRPEDHGVKSTGFHIQPLEDALAIEASPSNYPYNH